MQHIKFDSRWETIYQYIGRALFEATEKNVVLDCEFNGGKFVVDKNSTMDSAYADWQAAMQKQEEEYKNSDEYKEFQKEQEIKKNRMNQEVAILFEKFETLDFKPTTFEGMKAILDWLAEYQDYSDCVLCTSSNDSYVVKMFEDNGYVKDMWVGAPKDTFNDMTCYFEYIIGQAISTMKFLALHGSIIGMCNEWVRKFTEVRG